MIETKGIILYADDNPVLREKYKRILRKSFPDFEAVPCEDGGVLEKRLICETDGVRVVITDHNMPGISGLELIKKYSRQHKFPYILISGHSRQLMQRIAIESGAFAYLEKPTEIEDFVGTVRDALEYFSIRALSQ